MAGVEVEIIGLDDVVSKLQRLANPKLAKSIARKAAKQAMEIVKNAAIVNAKNIDDPNTTVEIWKNVANLSGRIRDKSAIRQRVGIRGGASFGDGKTTIVQKQRKKKGEAAVILPENTLGLSGGDSRHWRFVEFGTSSMPATPFMRPALASNIQQVTNKFAEVFDAELDKELLK